MGAIEEGRKGTAWPGRRFMGMWAYSRDSLIHSVPPSSWWQEVRDEWYRVLPWRLSRDGEMGLDPKANE